MDLFGVTEMSMQRTWKVSVGEVKLGGMAPDKGIRKGEFCG